MEAPAGNRWTENAVRFDREYNDDSPLYALPFLGSFVRENLHRRRDLVLELIGDVDGATVLDIGCGVGRISYELAQRGARVIGYDIAPDAVEYARAVAASEGLSERCTFHVGDVTEVDYPEADAWIAVGLVQYLPEPRALLDRLAHVSRFVCDVERRDHWVHPLRRVYRHFLRGNPFTAWTEEELSTLFPDLGGTRARLAVDLRNPTGFLVHTPR